MSRIVASVVLIVITALGCSSSAPPPVVEIKPPPVLTFAPYADGQLSVRYEREWKGLNVMLVGVDATNGHAYVRFAAKRPARVEIVQVDLKTGGVISTWQADKTRANNLAVGYPRFRPFGPDFVGDLRRYGAIVKATGPWHHRVSHAPGTVAASKDGTLVFDQAPTNGKDGDWLMRLDAAGKRVRIAPELRASYSPHFSADGRYLAFYGCEQTSPSACPYKLQIFDTKKKTLSSVDVRTQASPLWTGSSSLMVMGEQCAYVVRKVGEQWEPKKSKCVFAEGEVHVSEDGRWGVLSEYQLNQGSGEWVYHVIDPTTGEVVKELRNPEATSPPQLDGTTLWAATNKGLTGVDITTGAKRVVTSSTGRLSPVGNIGQSAYGLVLLRRAGDMVQLVTLGEQ